MELPVISYTQKLVLYETKARYYIVGSNKTETRFRVLKIDRTEPKDLVVHDDKVEYSKPEIRNILTMINVGNQTRLSHRGGVGLTKTVSAFGIVGFIRFLEGYYIILVTKRRKVAVIGPHTVYKIEDTSMLYIPNETVRYFHNDENRYVRMFQNVDLSSNFYFSYSYDLTHTLQYNMATGIKQHFSDVAAHSKEPESQVEEPERMVSPDLLSGPIQLENLEDAMQDFSNLRRLLSVNPGCDHRSMSKSSTQDITGYATRTKASDNYVWNIHLLKGFENVVHPDWIIRITHGFVGQSKLCIFGKPVYLTLIGRRSNQFAGTRFLKRGANSDGAVANEIETEQIVHDASVTFLEHSKVSSFTQLRGSIPLCWSQDTSKMVPKPPIMLDQRDPYAHIPGLHFNRVLKRFGAPVIVLNLVKTREKKRHESILSGEFMDSIYYLNQFLPPEHTIQYIGFDMARVNKRKDTDVLVRLAKIAKYCVKQTGFFLHLPADQARSVFSDEQFKSIQGHPTPEGCRQTGVVRTNCVDCLDRTNTAQFAVGKCAIAYQLYALGVLEKPHLDFETDCIRMLEDLYEDHGDTLALQYGGSQLVHRIKGYRKIAPWTSHSRDIMQTLSRYYSNAFSDLEKQQAFNLFLGIFEPCEGQLNLWELQTDYYLHNANAMGIIPFSRSSYSQWWDIEVCRSLPLPHEEESKPNNTEVTVLKTGKNDESVNIFHEYYKPFELTVLDELYCMSMTSSIRDFMPRAASDYSPFCLRRLPTNINQEKSGQETNPNISGKDSTVSVTSQGSEGSTSSTDDSDVEGDVNLSDSSSPYDSEHESSYFSFKDLFPSMKKVYDADIADLSKRDLNLYQRYLEIGKGSLQAKSLISKQSKSGADSVNQSKRVAQGLDIFPISAFKLDSTFAVEPPPVSRQSKDIYSAYVLRGRYGAGPPTDQDRHTYAKYVSNKFR